MIITKAPVQIDPDRKTFSKILMKPRIAYALDQNDTKTPVAQGFEQVRPMLSDFRASGDTFYLTISGPSNYIFIGYEIQAVMVNEAAKFGIVDWCKFSGDSFEIDATLYKEQLSGPVGAFAANNNYIANANYAPSWAQSPKNVVVTINANSSNKFTDSNYKGYPDIDGNEAPWDGTFILSMFGVSNEPTARNRLVINSFKRNGSVINYEWGAF